VAVRPIIASKKIDIGLIVLGFITGTLAFGAIGIIMGPLIIISWVAFVKIFLLEEKG
jgi:predicted PurR-regulated permease PerM